MSDKDLLEILLMNLIYVDAKKRAFITGVKPLVRKRIPLSPAQHQYLQSLYDYAVSKRYGLEPMATDGEMAAQRAIAKKRKLGK